MKSSIMQPMMKSEPTVIAARTELELASWVCFSFSVKENTKSDGWIINTVQLERKPARRCFLIFHREVSRPLSGGLMCSLEVPLLAKRRCLRFRLNLMCSSCFAPHRCERWGAKQPSMGELRCHVSPLLFIGWYTTPSPRQHTNVTFGTQTPHTL